MNGIERIAVERQRQIDEEGYSLEHDQSHTNGALAYAAACYASPGLIYHLSVEEGLDSDGMPHGTMTWHEPWPRGWKRSRVSVWSPRERIRDLVKAGALIAAEIDRLEEGGADEQEGRGA